MDSAYFVGRNEILTWINNRLQLNLSRIEEVLFLFSCFGECCFKAFWEWECEKKRSWSLGIFIWTLLQFLLMLSGTIFLGFCFSEWFIYSLLSHVRKLRYLRLPFFISSYGLSPSKLCAFLLKLKYNPIEVIASMVAGKLNGLSAWFFKVFNYALCCIFKGRFCFLVHFRWSVDHRCIISPDLLWQRIVGFYCFLFTNQVIGSSIPLVIELCLCMG